MCLRGSDATVLLLRTSVPGSALAIAKAADVVARRQILGPASLAETNGSISPFNGKQPRRAASDPMYRSILAIDIERSTKRNNPVKEGLRYELYRLLREALCLTGIGSQHYHHPFTDRGDGFLVLLRPVDEIPKRLLLSHLIPSLARLLAAYNSSISTADPARILRVRAVIHAGEVLCDGKGFFGEDLDAAFRLLDAPRFKAELKISTFPLALVVSDYVYQSVIKQGYQGIEDRQYLPLVTVNVGDQRRKGWVHLPAAGGDLCRTAAAAGLLTAGQLPFLACDLPQASKVKDRDMALSGLDEAACAPVAECACDGSTRHADQTGQLILRQGHGAGRHRPVPVGKLEQEASESLRATGERMTAQRAGCIIPAERHHLPVGACGAWMRIKE
jgi:hypothetical protein